MEIKQVIPKEHFLANICCWTFYVENSNTWYDERTQKT